jgi:hypothetical protein
VIRPALILGLIFLTCHPERSAGSAVKEPPLEPAARVSDRRLIEYAKKISAAKLDEQLAAIPLASWLRQAAGHDVRMTWEVNDCGEQSGDPDLDEDRDIPLCVEADLYVPGGGEGMVMIQVGTESKAPDGEPALRMLAVRPGSNVDWQDFEHLRELPGRLPR